MIVRHFTWEEVYQRIHNNFPDGKVFGIPRGGAIVAGICGAMPRRFAVVDDPAKADYIIDDVADSGATSERWYELHKKPVMTLVDKDSECIADWVAFPWEGCDPTADNTDHVRRIIEMLGEDPKRDGLRDTPQRVLRALKELTAGYQQDPIKILGSASFQLHCDEMIVVRDVEFWSLCEHHMLPFHGHAAVAYIPGEHGKIVGLSKLARVVQCYAQRLQIQERMTQEIAVAIEEAVQPLGVGVLITATHTCMAMRGVKNGATMTTSALRGLLKDHGPARAEFLAIARVT